MDITQLYGRLMTTHQLCADDIIQLKLIGENALVKIGRSVICRRCMFKNAPTQVRLPNGAYYCRNCIGLGRITSRDLLYNIKEPNAFNPPAKILTWNGELSKFQERCAKRLIQKVNQKQNHLIWAVTGAGKTEILFPMIAENLRKCRRIAIASPRIDVCNELFPRIQAAFANTKCLLLHGQSNHYYYSQLTVCTTHQLFKFRHAFDILIIDEVDSFPYVNDASLHIGAENARKSDGVMIFLTATPDKASLRKVHHHQISIDYLPLRFHQFMLPEVRFLLDRNISKIRKTMNFPWKLQRIVLKWVNQETPFLIFVPQIELLDPIFKAICKIIPENVKGSTVYANDPERLEKVQQLRNLGYRFLITTTILERGVTFKNLDLAVWDANHQNFSQSSLVQIAGRVGRSKSRPTGDVYFIVDHYSIKVKRAALQIKKLNQRARKLLDES